MAYKLTLADGSSVELDGYSWPMHLVAKRKNITGAAKVYSRLTDENLTSAVVLEDGNPVVEYANAHCARMQVSSDGDDAVIAHFYLSGDIVPDDQISDEDREYIKAAKILLGMEE